MTPHYDDYGDVHEHPQSKYDQALAHYDLHLHDDQVADSVRKLLDQHKSDYDTPDVRLQLLGSLELTSLKVTDSAESILALTERVNAFADDNPDLPHLAAVCVYPNFAQIVSQSLQADGVEVACVAGGFPSSQTFAEIKTAEAALAIHDGATEIDCVLNVGAYLSEDYETACDEIAEIKAVCGAALLAIYAGADFIKTSTGKIEPAATPEAAYVMCSAIKDYFARTGTKIGFKAAGGIATVDDALTYYTIVREVLGESWIKEGLFRIGASRLANRLAGEILDETKVYF